MKHLFILSQASEVMHRVVESLNLKKDNRIVCINTSIERKEPETLDWYHRDRQSLVDNGFEVTDYTLTGKTEDQLRADLADFPHIYVSGGDVAWLIEQSYRSGFINLVKELVEEKGVVYIGSSAGGIVCGPSIPSYYEVDQEYFGNKQVKGFGLVGFTSLPHWGRKDKSERYLRERLPIISNESSQPFIMLNDFQYVEVLGDTYKVIDTRKR